MASSTVEQSRLLHQDTEAFRRQIVDDLLEETRTVHSRTHFAGDGGAWSSEDGVAGANCQRANTT